MEAIQITTFILVAGLFLLEGMKIFSAFRQTKLKIKEHDEMEGILEALKSGDITGKITEIEIPPKKED